MTKTCQIRRKTYKSKKKHQDRVQDAKRQEKAQKVKKISIPSQHDGSPRWELLACQEIRRINLKKIFTSEHDIAHRSTME
jgi:hypothetical protein